MRRFSILNLMGVVFALAVGLAALRGANDNWAGGFMLATPLVFGVSLIGALCGKERSRPGRMGFAILGGGYYAMAFLGLSEGRLAQLPTSQLLQYVHERAVGPVSFTVFLTTTTTSQNGVVLTQNVSGPTPGSMSFVAMGSGATPVTAGPGGTVTAPPQARWLAPLRVSGDRDAFVGVGHCLFALLAGVLGASIARWFERGRVAERREGPITAGVGGAEE